MKAPYILGIVAGMLLPTLAMAQVPLQPCLEIEDQTKERLDCRANYACRNCVNCMCGCIHAYRLL